MYTWKYMCMQCELIIDCSTLSFSLSFSQSPYCIYAHSTYSMWSRFDKSKLCGFCDTRTCVTIETMEQQNPPMNAVTYIVSTDFANTVQIHDNENGIDSQVNSFRRPYCKKNPPKNPPNRAPVKPMYNRCICWKKIGWERNHKKRTKWNYGFFTYVTYKILRVFLWPWSSSIETTQVLSTVIIRLDGQ